MSLALVQPVVALMTLTLVVWLYMYVRRLAYVFANAIDAQELATPEQRDRVLPEAVNRPSNNLSNLFELPVVFYAICLLLLALGESDPLYVNLAWAYVALRAAHSAIHCTINIVTLRFTAYLLSSIVLWIMLGRLALAHF